MSISAYRSYLPAINFMPPLVSGRYYDSVLYSGVTYGTSAFNNLTMGNLFAIPNTVTVSSVGIETTLGTSGSLRFGIYSIDAYGFPNQLVYDTGQGGQTGNVGYVSISISKKLLPGWYWIFVSPSATSGGGIRGSTTGLMHAESGSDLATVNGTAWLGIALTGGNPNIYTNGFPKTWVHLNLIGTTVRSGSGINYWRVIIGV